jgi:mRNA-degrading endonuclease RelE of RelBE toxin-antitoxin system
VKLIISAGSAQAMHPRSMPRRDAAALLRKLTALAEDPFASRPWALPLSGQSDRVRVRQGDWRAVALIARSEDTVIVERVEHRKEVYR